MKKLNNRIISLYLGFLAAFITVLSGCAPHRTLSTTPEIRTVVQADPTAFSPVSAPGAERFAPAFVIRDAENPVNLIGTVSAKYDESGKEKLYVDPGSSTFYVGSYEFKTNRAAYRNLVYRIHFKWVPFSLFPFNLTAGSNSGLLVVITLDPHEQPVLVTTVHTCGCYLAIIPTTDLPTDALPETWDTSGGPLNVYGERLPRVIDFNAVQHPRLLIHLRADVHRVMNVEVVSDSTLTAQNGYRRILAALAPMSDLNAIPIDGTTTSFFYQEGEMKGHVKGAQKPWESLMLSWISLDYFVGMDKAYADTGNPFYTSLKPWRRHDSDMWHFATFLNYWGWRL
jgi:hypothetical protein